MILRRKTWASSLIIQIILMRTFRVHAITCSFTKYKIGNECCPMCRAGSRVKTDCTEFRSTSCLLCTEGTYTEQPNELKSCNPCSVCDSGAGLKVKKECKLHSDTACEPMEGFFCTDPKSGGCAVAQKHRSCEPGQLIKIIGTSSTDTVCSDCISGTFSNGTTLSCQPHTQCEKENLQMIKAGTASTDAECGEKSSNTAAAVVGVMVVIVILVPAVVGVVYFVLRKNKQANSSKGDKNKRVKPDRGEVGMPLNEQVEELPV